jgi:hypothetical protein
VRLSRLVNGLLSREGDLFFCLLEVEVRSRLVIPARACRTIGPKTRYVSPRSLW